MFIVVTVYQTIIKLDALVHVLKPLHKTHLGSVLFEKLANLVSPCNCFVL